MMKLLDLYRSLLSCANMVVTSDNCVSRSFGGKTEPAMIKGKRLVLPTKEHLSNPDWKERVAFHPLSENILRGESTVLEDFRTSLNVRLNYTIGLLAYQLMVIATSPDEHKKLNPDQTEFLSKVKAADESTLEALKKLMKAMKTDQSNRAFVHIFLKRSGTVAGRKHSRVGVVTFPLYEELKNPKAADDGVWGVKMRKKHIETLKALFEYMIPNIETAEAHNRGSDSTIAPYLDALMKAVLGVAAPLNDLIELFRNQLETGDENDAAGPDKLLFDDKWVEVFENLEVMQPEIRAIPMQAGNDGPSGKPAQSAGAAAAGVPATPTPAAPASPLPAALTNPQPVVNWGTAPAQPASAFATAAASAPVRTERGVDFDSLLRSNPALAQQVGGVGSPQTSWQGNAQGQAAPRWAGGGFGSGPSWGGGQQQSNFGGGQGWGYRPSI
jgi:hypothetical protein